MNFSDTLGYCIIYMLRNFQKNLLNKNEDTRLNMSDYYEFLKIAFCKDANKGN